MSDEETAKDAAKDAAKAKAKATADAIKRQILTWKKESQYFEAAFEALADKVSSWIPTPGAALHFPPAVPSAGELNVVEKDLEQNKREQDARAKAVFLACHGAEYCNDHGDDYKRIMKNLDKALSAVQDLRAVHFPGPGSAGTTSSSTVTITPYKEKVILPQFDGNLTKWKEFHDLFLHKVKAENITAGVSKLAILKVQLTGRAADVISDIALTDANFDAAWDLLVSRFEDKRELIYAHINKFYEYPNLTSESGLGLQNLLNLVNNLVTSLTNISVDVAKSDVFILYIAVRKLDSNSKAWWSMTTKSEVPTVKEFTDFLNTRSKALLESQPSSSSSISNQEYSAPSGSQKKVHHVSYSKCLQCGDSHPIWKCLDFQALPTQSRWDLVKANRICVNCLGSHRGPCTSKFTCHKDDCGQPHHTLLHVEHSSGGPKPKASLHSRITNTQSESVTILGTILVDVKDSNGVKQPCRVFVDGGSEISFVTSGCLRRLGLKPMKTYVPLTVVGNISGKPARGKLSLTMESRSEQYALNLEALVLNEFTGMVPSVNFVSQWPHFDGIEFSDPKYHIAGKCDILLGGKKSHHILLPEVVSDSTNSEAPVAWNTRFGWMAKGEAPPVTKKSRPFRPRSNHVRVSGSPNEPDETQVWDQESPEAVHTIRSDRDMSSDDMTCETPIVSAHTRIPDGNYAVELPPNRNPTEFGKPATKNEFLELGYTEPVPAEEEIGPFSTGITFRAAWNAVIKPPSVKAACNAVLTPPPVVAAWNAAATFSTFKPAWNAVPKPSPVTTMIQKWTSPVEIKTVYPLHLVKHCRAVKSRIYCNIPYLHPRHTLLLPISRENFWIRRGRNLMAKVVLPHVICYRVRAVKSNQLMEQLHIFPINPFLVSSNTGYTRPFPMAICTGRNTPSTSAYVVPFWCIVTKAIHTELIPNLSTVSLLATLQRFIYRRGAATDSISHDETNFVGARSVLAQLHELNEAPSHVDAVHHLWKFNFLFNNPCPPHRSTSRLDEVNISAKKLMGMILRRPISKLSPLPNY